MPCRKADPADYGPQSSTARAALAGLFRRPAALAAPTRQRSAWPSCFEHFAELRALDQLALVLRVAVAEGWPADAGALAELRAGLRIILELQRRGRGPRRRRVADRHPAGAEA